LWDTGKMAAVAEKPQMAREDLTVKMGMDVVKRAKVVALARYVTLAQYLTELVRPLVDAYYEQEVARMAREVRPKRNEK
jgi:hypothetical protein